MDALRTLFTTLYDSEVNNLFGFICSRISNRERAKELTNEVFLKLWQQMSRGNSIEMARAYMYTTARNLIKNEYRSRREYNEGEDALVSVVDETSETSRYALAKELHSFLQKISPTYAEALSLRYLSGLAVKDIAVIMNTSETNISMRIKRGLDALKQFYESERQPKN